MELFAFDLHGFPFYTSAEHKSQVAKQQLFSHQLEIEYIEGQFLKYNIYYMKLKKDPDP
jgi:hypothetical protein